MRRSKFSAFLATTIILAFCTSVGGIAPAQAQATGCQITRANVTTGTNSTSITSSKLQRSFIVHVPAGYPQTSDPVPLVFTLHGLDGSGQQVMNHTQWNPVADQHNFIVVYPDGTSEPRQWGAYPNDPRSRARRFTDPNDVQFFRDLLTYMNDHYCIDPARIYVDGVSNGGAMTVQLACVLNDQLAAVSTVAAAVLRNRVCTPPAPIPLMEFHGTDDPLVPYDSARGLFEPVQQWTAAWATANGCAASPQALPTQGEVSGVEYVNCTNDATVILYTIAGGGHSWPGSKSRALLENTLGHTTQDIDATTTMWDFFEAHPRKGVVSRISNH